MVVSNRNLLFQVFFSGAMLVSGGVNRLSKPRKTMMCEMITADLVYTLVMHSALVEFECVDEMYEVLGGIGFDSTKT